MTDLQELYQSVILDHNRKPRNFGELPAANRHADGKNPLCGDEVHVALVVEHDVITDVKFTGHGCAISKASASLMTAAVKGKSRDEAEALFQRFHTLVLGPRRGQGSRPAGRLRWCVALPGAREVRLAGVAHAESRAGERTGAGVRQH
jgi:nitrogen fixation NifU-like protein